MPEPIIVEKSFGYPNKNRFFEVREGAGNVTLADLNKLAAENKIDPEYFDVMPDCDHYGGPEGPDKYLWVSWPTDKQGK